MAETQGHWWTVQSPGTSVSTTELKVLPGTADANRAREERVGDELRVGGGARSYSINRRRRPRFCTHEAPRCPSYLQLRGGQRLVQFQELCFSPCGLKLLQQDSGPDFGKGQAPVHLSEAAVNFLPHPEQLLFGQGEGRGPELSGKARTVICFSGEKTVRVVLGGKCKFKAQTPLVKSTSGKKNAISL